MSGFLVVAIVFGTLFVSAFGADGFAATRYAYEPRTVFVDYSNRPDVMTCVSRGWDMILCSPRADSRRANYAVDSLRAYGVEVAFWIQPFICTWNGQFIRGWPYDNAIHDAVFAAGDSAILRNADGSIAFVSGSDIEGCAVLAFNDSAFVSRYIEVLRGLRADRILFDYGCPDLAWETSISVPDSVWERWRVGYSRIKSAFTESGREAVCQCDAPSGCDGIALEKVGWSLTSFKKAWGLLSAVPGSPDIVLGSLFNDPGRRVLAGMSLLTGASFNWGFGSDAWNRINPEHFDLILGPIVWRPGDQSPWWERTTDVYQARFKYGQVILNLSESEYRYGRRTIGAEDALIVQFRDPKTGKFIKWRTTTDSR
jgi:hypothetical protein